MWILPTPHGYHRLAKNEAERCFASKIVIYAQKNKLCYFCTQNHNNMSVIPLLAKSLGIRSTDPNIELAEKIAASNDHEAITELVAILAGKDKTYQSDAIKVLYETAERNSMLLVPHSKVLMSLLTHKNNRMQWGAMTALDAIATHIKSDLYGKLTEILDVMNAGSVITRDHGMGILITLCGDTAYQSTIYPLINHQLLASPENQLPAYSEKTLPVVPAESLEQFCQTLSSRLPSMESETKKKRVEKVLKTATARLTKAKK
ncbi:MAG: hypothetical protein EBX41_04435 [Chitinophagia bacterium]|nr:hypothetical protein [Chitinophagia bacterium]